VVREMNIVIANTTISGRWVMVGEKKARITRMQMVFLQELLSVEGRVYTRERMHDVIDREAGDGVTPRYMDVILCHIRSNLAWIGSEIEIKTHFGIGWSLPQVLKVRTIEVSPAQLAALLTAVTAYESVNPRIAEIARSAL
jgi:DNA-binding response OmpR family regulator